MRRDFLTEEKCHSSYEGADPACPSSGASCVRVQPHPEGPAAARELPTGRPRVNITRLIFLNPNPSAKQPTARQVLVALLLVVLLRCAPPCHLSSGVAAFGVAAGLWRGGVSGGRGRWCLVASGSFVDVHWARRSGPVRRARQVGWARRGGLRPIGCQAHGARVVRLVGWVWFGRGARFVAPRVCRRPIGRVV